MRGTTLHEENPFLEKFGTYVPRRNTWKEAMRHVPNTLIGVQSSALYVTPRKNERF